MRPLEKKAATRRAYMAKDSGSHTPSSVQLNYQLLRNTTSPDEAAQGVKSFVANLPEIGRAHV